MNKAENRFPAIYNQTFTWTNLYHTLLYQIEEESSVLMCWWVGKRGCLGPDKGLSGAKKNGVVDPDDGISMGYHLLLFTTIYSLLRLASLHKGPLPQVRGFNFFNSITILFTSHVFGAVAPAINCLYLNIFLSSAGYK